MGVQNFESVLSARAVGTPDVLAQAEAMRKLADSIEGLGRKSEQVKPPKWEQFAAGIRDSIQNPLDAAGNAVEGFLTKLGPVGTGISVAAAGMGILAVKGFEAAKALGEYGDRIGDTAIRLGMTTKEVGEFSFAMKYAGGDISTVEAAVRTLSRGLAANDEEGKKVKATLKSLGVDAAAPISQVLLQLSERLSGMANAAERNTAAMNLFGRAGLQLLPDLLELTEGVRRAKELGLGPSDEDIKRWDGYHKKIAEAEALWERLTRQLKEPIAGIATVVIKRVVQGSYRDRGIYGGTGEGNLGGWNSDILGDTLKEWREKAAKQARDTAAIPDRQAADSIVAGEKARILRTKEGIESALSDARKELDKARDELFAGNFANAAAANEAKAKYGKESAAVADLQARLEAINKAEKSAEELAKLAIKGRQHIEYYKALIARAAAGPVGTVTGELGTTTGTGLRDFGIVALEDIKGNTSPDYGRLFTQNLEAQINADREAIQNIRQAIATADQAARSRIEADVSGMRAGAQHQGRIAELMAEPGQEVQALQRSLSIRLESARVELEMKRARSDVFDMAKEEAVFEREAQQARYEYEEKILELRKQQREQGRRAFEETYDALLSGGSGGIGALLKSQVLGYGRTIAGNVGEGLYSTMQKSLPHLNVSWLRGTPFGPDPLQQATAANTMATIENTLALRGLSMSATGGGGGLVRGFADIARLYNPVPGTDWWNNTPGEVPYAHSPIPTTLDGAFTTKTPGKFNYGRAIGIGGAVAAGAYGAYSGYSAGGAQGILTGTGSLAGAAGTIMALSGVSGPAAPIVAGIGMALGFAAALFGDPKKKRAEELERAAQARAFDEPTGSSYTYDISGRQFDYDYRGRMRPVVVNNYNTNIEAMDAQSFVEWGRRNPAAIAEVSANAVNSGNGGDFVGAMREGLQLA